MDPAAQQQSPSNPNTPPAGAPVNTLGNSLNPQQQQAYNRVMATPVNPAVKPAAASTPQPTTPTSAAPPMPTSPSFNLQNHPVSPPPPPPAQPAVPTKSPTTPSQPSPFSAPSFHTAAQEEKNVISYGTDFPPKPKVTEKPLVVTKKSGISPVVVILVGVIFFAAYTFFWLVFFKYPLPFLK